MKNIYLIETKEPTANILLVKDNGEIQIFDKSFYDMWKFHQQFGDFAPSNAVYKNIYITSSEEIKEGDWFALDMSHSSTLPDEIHQMGSDNWSKTGGIHFCEGNSWIKSCKKIILTTDQDLIKDGVQAIDDEFLCWFVKNPICESVETIIEYKDGYGNWFKYDKEFWDKMGNKPKFGIRYKAIITKEELKRGYSKSETKLLGIEFTLKDGTKQFIPNPEISEEAKQRAKHTMLLKDTLEPKQETLEEAAIEYSKMYFSENKKAELGFIAGTKWQAERSFTLEQIDKLFFNENGIGYFDEYLNYKINDGKTFIQITFKEWFNTFKKK
jgi:hypothetical protein